MSSQYYLPYLYSSTLTPYYVNYMIGSPPLYSSIQNGWNPYIYFSNPVISPYYGSSFIANPYITSPAVTVFPYT